MDRPKRRRKKDNPYNLTVSNFNYRVCFKDSRDTVQEVKISKEIFDLLNEFELDDLKELNEFDRHIEHNEVYEETLYHRLNYTYYSLEDDFIRKSSFEELYDAINKLPEIQKRRIKKYYFDEMTEEEIAKEEDSTQQAIHKSLRSARYKLKEILKN